MQQRVVERQIGKRTLRDLVMFDPLPNGANGAVARAPVAITARAGRSGPGGRPRSSQGEGLTACQWAGRCLPLSRLGRPSPSSLPEDAPGASTSQLAAFDTPSFQCAAQHQATEPVFGSDRYRAGILNLCRSAVGPVADVQLREQQ